jgi:hypothetical protein
VLVAEESGPELDVEEMEEEEGGKEGGKEGWEPSYRRGK